MNYYRRDDFYVFSHSSRAESFSKKGMERIIDGIIRGSNDASPDFSNRVVFAIHGVYGVFMRSNIQDEKTVDQLCGYIENLFCSSLTTLL